MRHGIAGVDHEIHQHLPELTRIHHDRQRPLHRCCGEREPFPEQPPQHALDVVHGHVYVDFGGRDLLPPTEGQQLRRQHCGTLTGFHDLIQLGAQIEQSIPQRQRRIVVHQRDGLLIRELREAHHCGEQIVEIMRDAAGERAHRFHFLRVQQLLFQQTPFGYVGQHADNARRYRPGRDTVGERCRGDMQPARAAIVLGHHVLGLRKLALHRPRDIVAHGVTYCRRNQIEKPIDGHDPCFTGETEQLERLLRQRHGFCRRIVAP